jgi:hypothetical protein
MSEDESTAEDWQPRHVHKKHIRKWPRETTVKTLDMNSLLAPKALKIVRHPLCPDPANNCRYKARARCNRRWESGRQPSKEKGRCPAYMAKKLDRDEMFETTADRMAKQERST